MPSNPSEILSGRRISQLLTEMGARYDYVIVDSAPVLPVSDSVALAASVDGVLVVAHAGRVTRANIGDMLERLDRVAAPVLGLVLNQARKVSKEYYSYGGYAPTRVRRCPPESTAVTWLHPTHDRRRCLHSPQSCRRARCPRCCGRRWSHRCGGRCAAHRLATD